MKTIHFLPILSLLFSTNVFATPDCSKAPAVKIELFSEEHGTVAAERVWIQLLSEAAYGESRVFFEALPRSANSNAEEKNMYIQQFVEVGYPSATAAAPNIYGMDSNELKFISIASAMYILNAFDGVMRDPVYMNLLILSMEMEDVKEALLRSPEFANVYREFLKLDSEKFATVLISTFDQAPDSFRAFLLSAIQSMTQDMEKQGYVLFKPDLVAFAVKGDPFKNDEQLITYSIGDRNKYMTDSVLEVVCNSTSKLPLKLSIGFRHAPGMENLLKAALPKSEIIIVPHQ